MKQTALKLRGVTAGYGSEPVLKDISFSLEEGKRLAILGPNGSGKTTLLRVLDGLLEWKGELKILGKDAAGLKREELARSVAMMGQFAGASLPYTVEETVLMGRYIHMSRGILAAPGSEDLQAARNCIDAVGLAGWEQRRVTELSGGQLQRVFLARTLAQQPSIILLDEPTSHLDLKYQTELTDYIRRWGEQPGHTVVGVLHDINLALRMADTFLFIKEGKCLAFGGAEILTAELLTEAYGMDVAAYMRESADRMEDIVNGKSLQKPL